MVVKTINLNALRVSAHISGYLVWYSYLKCLVNYISEKNCYMELDWFLALHWFHGLHYAIKLWKWTVSPNFFRSCNAYIPVIFFAIIENSKIQCQPVKRIGFMKTHKTASRFVWFSYFTQNAGKYLDMKCLPCKRPCNREEFFYPLINPLDLLKPNT